jgi:hypothetical protein
MLYGESQIEPPSPARMQDAVPNLSTTSPFSTSLPPNSISHPLSQPINEIAANFFFANYSCNEPPFSESYQAWLTQIYSEARPNHALRVAIEAVGLAGISNVSYAPNLASKSQELYGRALAATKQALSDPIESIADSTLMSVITLGLFEVNGVS